MRILLPDVRVRDVLRKKKKRRRSLRAVVLVGLGISAVAFYVFPGTKQPRDLYSSVDFQVLRSLAEARSDYPLERIDVGGTIWAYRHAGQGREAIVFLHGFGGSSDIWWQQLRSLDANFTALATNYGRVRTLEQATAGITALLDAEGISRAHIVGTSLGGYVAQALAERYPDRVSSLVLANTFPPGPWLRGRIRVVALLAPVTPTWLLRSMFRRSIQNDVFPASGQSALVRDFLLQQSYSMTREDFLTRIRLLRDTFEAPDVVALKTPTLIIEADNDPLVTPAGREELRAAYPSASVVTLEEVGHFPYLNRPAQYTRTLEDFFDSFRIQRSTLDERSGDGKGLGADSAQARS